MNSIYAFGGEYNLGYQRSVNEDFIDAVSLDEKTLFLAVADGAGSLPGELQPAAIAVCETVAVIRRYFQQHKDVLLSIPETVIAEAMQTANRVLNVFHICDEEKYAGFGASLTCCLVDQISGETKMAVASTGNTRLYLLRMQKDRTPALHQLTTDQTKATELLNSGIITPEQYYAHPDRLLLTGALGITAEPVIQTIEDLPLRKDDIVILTSDGIHYAIRPEAMSSIILESGSCADASKSLIEAAKLEKYPDNMSVVIAYLLPLK